MSTTMHVTMISPDIIREFTAEWVEVTTVVGSHVILPGHAPFIAQLATHQTVALKLPGGAVKSMPVTGGIVDIDRTRMVIVVEL